MHGRPRPVLLLLRHCPGDVEGALRESLGRLGLDYVDAYLMHWPFATNVRRDGRDRWIRALWYWVRVRSLPCCWSGTPREGDQYPEIEDTWRAMEQCVHQGLARGIGICNTSPGRIQRILGKSLGQRGQQQAACMHALPVSTGTGACYQSGGSTPARWPCFMHRCR